jgi:hypothetical protein
VGIGRTTKDKKKREKERERVLEGKKKGPMDCAAAVRALSALAVRFSSVVYLGVRHTGRRSDTSPLQKLARLSSTIFRVAPITAFDENGHTAFVASG